nr:hypothetical protein Iba_chr04dCG11090 [Ipomoea batatas]
MPSTSSSGVDAKPHGRSVDCWVNEAGSFSLPSVRLTKSLGLAEAQELLPTWWATTEPSFSADGKIERNIAGFVSSIKQLFRIGCKMEYRTRKLFRLMQMEKLLTQYTGLAESFQGDAKIICSKQKFLKEKHERKRREEGEIKSRPESAVCNTTITVALPSIVRHTFGAILSDEPSADSTTTLLHMSSPSQVVDISPSASLRRPPTPDITPSQAGGLPPLVLTPSCPRQQQRR